VRELLRHVPKERRALDTWRHGYFGSGDDFARIAARWASFS